MNIKVIGSGCETCGKLYEDVVEVVEELNLGALLGTFVGIVTIGMIIIGYLFNWMSGMGIF